MDAGWTLALVMDKCNHNDAGKISRGLIFIGLWSHMTPYVTWLYLNNPPFCFQFSHLEYEKFGSQSLMIKLWNKHWTWTPGYFLSFLGMWQSPCRLNSLRYFLGTLSYFVLCLCFSLRFLKQTVSLYKKISLNFYCRALDTMCSESICCIGGMLWPRMKWTLDSGQSVSVDLSCLSSVVQLQHPCPLMGTRRTHWVLCRGKRVDTGAR